MNSVIITGAGGFIGSTLSRAMAAKGYTVYAIVYNEHELNVLEKNNNIIPVLGDLLKCEDIEEQIDHDVDILIHLAWCGISAQDYKDINLQKLNFDMTINTVELAKKKNCKRFVFAGTMYEHLVGKNKFSGSLSHSSIYGTCKLCANKLCEVLTNNCMEYVSIAFTNVFGVGDRSKRTPNVFIKKLMTGQDLDLIEGNYLYDWIYIDDAVQGMICAAEKGISGKQYLIGNITLRTFRQIIENVRDIIAPDASLNFGKYHDETFTDFSHFDTNALYNDTGFECTSDFKESILKTAEWVKTLDI